MKFLTLALLFAAAPLLSAQTIAHPGANASPSQNFPQMITVQPEDLSHTGGQSGCPVQVSEASFTRPARYMPVNAAADWYGQLSLDYTNASGKDIRFIEVKADLLTKKSIYDLDATRIAVDLTLGQNGVLARGITKAETLTVKANAFGLSGLSLERVVFTDGTMWTPSPGHQCEFPNMGGMMIEAR